MKSGRMAWVFKPDLHLEINGECCQDAAHEKTASNDVVSEEEEGRATVRCVDLGHDLREGRAREEDEQSTDRLQVGAPVPRDREVRLSWACLLALDEGFHVSTRPFYSNSPKTIALITF